MIHELAPERFGRVRPLFATAWADRAQIEAIFEGRQRGRIFVDDPERPRAALLVRTYEFYVAGEPETVELRRFIYDAPAEAEVFNRFYGYVPISVAMTRAMLADHAGRLEVVARRGFRWLAGERSEAALTPWRSGAEGIELRPIDRELAERIDGELDQMIGGFWDGHDAFAADGFGVCALVDGAIASVAYAIAVGGGEANIDVATAERFRRRGLASRVCTAFIDHCLAHGLVPTWDCDADNHASAALARSLGFTEGPPFTELALPGRAKPPPTRGIWRPVPPSDGAVASWQRRSEAPRRS